MLTTGNNTLDTITDKFTTIRDNSLRITTDYYEDATADNIINLTTDTGPDTSAPDSLLDLTSRNYDDVIPGGGLATTPHGIPDEYTGKHNLWPHQNCYTFCC